MVLAGFQVRGSKRAIFELGGFAYAFAEITVEKNLEPKVLQSRIQTQYVNISSSPKKIKSSNTVFSFFYGLHVARRGQNNTSMC